MNTYEITFSFTTELDQQEAEEFAFELQEDIKENYLDNEIDKEFIVLNVKKTRETKICPKCGIEREELQAISRKDNKTKICSKCATREALQDFVNHLESK